MKLYLATANLGKVKELIPLCREYLPFAGEIIPRAAREAAEVADTFQGNAEIKARALVSELRTQIDDFLVLADDSGLEVAALKGRPGVHSARFAGDHVGAEENVAKLLCELERYKEPQERACRYVCSLSLIKCSPAGKEIWFGRGVCEGRILENASGMGGFGYDPVFWSVDLGKRMSEAGVTEKNLISHRRRAFEGLFAATKSLQLG